MTLCDGAIFSPHDAHAYNRLHIRHTHAHRGAYLENVYLTLSRGFHGIL
jgi:hypothetical protein